MNAPIEYQGCRSDLKDFIVTAMSLKFGDLLVGTNTRSGTRAIYTALLTLRH